MQLIFIFGWVLHMYDQSHPRSLRSYKMVCENNISEDLLQISANEQHHCCLDRTSSARLTVSLCVTSSARLTSAVLITNSAFRTGSLPEPKIPFLPMLRFWVGSGLPCC